jgi:outer membrane receptor protein involved in Fe transport
MALAALSVAALVEAAQAQTPAPQTAPPSPDNKAASPDQPAGKEAVRKFEPAFFARYNPVTAWDMVRQIPGFSPDNGDSLRGFGATAGNMLIDGQRPSTKATAVSDELTRIPARDVARIELISASAAGDIDVRGYTELANVVLKPAAKVQVSNTYIGNMAWQGEHVSTRGGLTRAWKGHDFSARLNTQLTEQQQRRETDLSFFNAAGGLTGTREDFNVSYFGELLFNGSINWTPTPRDTYNLNGRLMGRTYNTQAGGTSRSVAGAPTAFFSDDYTEKDIVYVDLGGDWEHKFSPQNSIKLISINSFTSWRPQEFFQQFPGAGPRSSATRINSDNMRGEHVLRGVWTLKPNDKHTVEMGLEGAFNYLETNRSVSNAVAAGPFNPQFLPVASTRVEEKRIEASINDTWRVSPQLTLETAFNFEASTITQTGDANQERDFTYPKPRFTATWIPDGKDQFVLGLERTVAQLNFSEFASVVQLVQGQLTVGNPDLKPAQTTELSLQWKRPIGQRGSILLRGFYDKINDVQDFVILQTGPTTFFTGSGNIGDGERYGLRLEVAYPLDNWGVKGGMLKLFMSGRDSSVTDPISKQDRPIVGDFTFDANIDFRQDLPEHKIAWGGDYTFPGGEVYAFRLNEIQRNDFGHGDLDLFIETTKIKGVTLRLNLDNLGDSTNYLQRRFFTPSRLPGGVFSSSEFRESTNGPIITFTAQGTF